MSVDPKKAKPIFLSAVEDYPPDEWGWYLDRACGEDAELRHRVEVLLAAHQRTDRLTEHGAAVMNAVLPAIDLPPVSEPPPVTEMPGAVIDRYRLVEQIGEGGFGVVFLAEQEQPVRRKVALKIIKPGMDSKEVIARFEVERQTLALMEHPNIARVLDAAATESGRPYFVMELVRGVPITDYCDQHNLSARERLELFVTVCQAVQHAHQKGIIHRDIKPSNVMVTLRDDTPVVKVIDFGVAKATNQRLAKGTASTRFAQMVGTPLYMSPEQAGINNLDVDTRSDIYSLGVLLYELLTGTTPFDKRRIRESPYDELLSIIREEDPPKPSTRISTLGDAATTIAVCRNTDPSRLRQLLRGDLDWIVMKAMEKDRTRRYETAIGLAIDVRRHLADEPVRARPPSRVYQLRKFVRRNRLAVAATACVTVAVVVAVSFALAAHRRSLRETEARLALRQAKLDQRVAEFRAQQAEREQHAEEQSRLEAENRATEAHVDALVEQAQRLNSGVYPNFPRAVELLTDAIEHRPEDARLYLYRGSALYELDRHQEAVADLERSLELQPSGTPATHWLIAIGAQLLGDEEKARRHGELARQSDPDSVESLVVQALAMPYDERGIELLTEAIRREPFDPLWYYYRGRIAYNVTVRKTPKRLYDLAVADLEKALLGRPHDPQIVETLCRCLVHFHFLADAGERPLERARQLLDQWIAVQGETGLTLTMLADWSTAARQAEAAIEACLKGHQLEPERASLLFLLGWAYGKLGRHDEAAEALSQALDLEPQLSALGGSSGRVAGYAGRATTYLALGREDLARLDLAKATQAAPRQHWTFYDWFNLISAYREFGDFEDGLKWSEEYVSEAPECSRARFWRGTLNADLGRYEEGIADFLKAIELNPAAGKSYTALATLYMKRGEHQAALEACDRWVRSVPDSSDAYRWRGLFQYELRNYQEAMSDCGEALRWNPRDSRAYYNRARTYMGLKQNDKALADFNKALELDPEDVDVYRGRGNLQYDLKRYELAVDDFSRLLERFPKEQAYYRRRGEAFRKLKRYDAALADFDRVLDLNPQDATTYDRRGLVYTAQKRHAEAVTQYARAIELNPREPWANAHIVDAYVELENYDAALRCCDRWLVAEPGSNDAQRMRGVVHFTSGNHQAALDALGDALKQNSNDHIAYLERGRVYAELKQPAKALADYNKSLELKPNYGPVYYSRGVSNAKLRRYQQAAADFTRAIQYSGSTSWLHYHRADAYRRLGWFDEAMADSAAALKLDPSLALCHFQRGSILAAQDRYQEALVAYSRALEINPGERYGRHSMVHTYCALGDYASARSFCDEWIGLDPESSDPHRYRGFVHYCFGAYQRAVDDYTWTLDRDPNDYRSLFSRGQAYVAWQRYDEGQVDIAKSLQVCPDSQAASHQRVVGEFYGELQQWDRAEPCFAKSVELDPEDFRQWHLLALAQLAQDDQQGYRRTCQRMLRHFGRTEDPATAQVVAATAVLQDVADDSGLLVALANQSVESRPEDDLYRWTLGAVLYRTGCFEEALTHLNEADRLRLQAQPSSPELAAWVPCFLAMAHQRQGNEDEAKRWLNKARYVEPPNKSLPLSGELPQWSRRLIAELLRREAATLIGLPMEEAETEPATRESLEEQTPRENPLKLKPDTALAPNDDQA